MKKNNLLTILFSSFIAFASCNQKEQVPGPQGPAGKDAINLIIKKDGYAKGKMFVTDQQGEDSLVGDFNYEYIAEPFVQSKYVKGDNGSFDIFRGDSTMDQSYFNLYCYSAPSQTAPEQAYIDFFLL